MNDRPSQLEVICHHASIALFVTDLQLRCTYMNPAAERLTGYSLADVEGSPLPEILGCSCGRQPDTAVSCRIFRALAQQRGERGQDRCHTKDGRAYDVAYSALPIAGTEGPIGLMVELQDITERKRQEANQDFLMSISKDFDRLTGPDVLMQIVGGRLCRYLGASSCTFGLIDAEAGLLTVREAWQRENQPSLRQTFRLADYHTEEFMTASQAGRTMVIEDTETASHTDPIAHVPLEIRAYVTVPGFRDQTWSYQFSVISTQPRQWRPDEVALIEEFAHRFFPRFERARAEQALLESEAHYRELFDAIDQGFCVIKVLFGEEDRPVDLLFITTNPAFDEHTGIQQAAGKRMKELVPDFEQHWLDTFAKVIATGEPARFVRTSEAMGRWFDVEAFRTGDPDEKRVALLFTDITAQKKAEAALQQAHAQLLQADRSKDDFLAMLAHELRNPLAALHGVVGWLQRHASDDIPAAKLAMLDRQTSILHTLVDELLDVSRVTRGLVALRLATVDLCEIAANAVESTQELIQKRHHQLETHLPDKPLFVQGDAVRLEQVLTNLLTNACKYTDPGGRIRLSLERGDDQAVIRVLDNGIGIAADMLPLIFGLFTQVERGLDRSRGGLGLGLTITRNLVEQHGGRIEAYSAGLGRGAEFVVYLPMPARPPGEQQPAPSHAGQAAARRRVLVVEDNRDIGETLVLLLEDLGHEVELAADGPDALAKAPAFQPEFIFLDIGLPGMDGFEVARRLRQDPALEGVTLCALSGYGGAEFVERAVAAGFDSHLTKPVNIEVLQRLIDAQSMC